MIHTSIKVFLRSASGQQVRLCYFNGCQSLLDKLTLLRHHTTAYFKLARKLGDFFCKNSVNVYDRDHHNLLLSAAWIKNKFYRYLLNHT